MNKKTLIILIVVVIVLAIGGFFAYRVLSPSSGGKTPLSSDSDVGTLPDDYAPYEINIPISSPPERHPPTGETFDIQTTQGSVAVKNFYNDHPIDPNGIGVNIVDNADYNIYYNIDFGSFTITLYRQPLEANRHAAEQALLQALGVKPTDVCKLNAHLNVLGGVDPSADGGADYGLSFCPNQIPL
jgi:flagellar basal body-associated protein FliL